MRYYVQITNDQGKQYFLEQKRAWMAQFTLHTFRAYKFDLGKTLPPDIQRTIQSCLDGDFNDPPTPYKVELVPVQKADGGWTACHHPKCQGLGEKVDKMTEEIRRAGCYVADDHGF